MSIYKLKDNHPTMVKLAQLVALADKLGISINYTRGGHAMVDDKELEQSFFLNNVDDLNLIMSFPPQTEYKLTFTK